PRVGVEQGQRVVAAVHGAAAAGPVGEAGGGGAVPGAQQLQAPGADRQAPADPARGVHSGLRGGAGRVEPGGRAADGRGQPAGGDRPAPDGARGRGAVHPGRLSRPGGEGPGARVNRHAARGPGAVRHGAGVHRPPLRRRRARNGPVRRRRGLCRRGACARRVPGAEVLHGRRRGRAAPGPARHVPLRGRRQARGVAQGVGRELPRLRRQAARREL
ncbi:hypothetical protein IWQ57_005735, partial [Coemansia nantahalensis]